MVDHLYFLRFSVDQLCSLMVNKNTSGAEFTKTTYHHLIKLLLLHLDIPNLSSWQLPIMLSLSSHISNSWDSLHMQLLAIIVQVFFPFRKRPSVNAYLSRHPVWCCCSIPFCYSLALLRLVFIIYFCLPLSGLKQLQVQGVGHVQSNNPHLGQGA